MPVVLLTGRTSVDDVVAGLDAGADDFLAKPFHEAELLARLRSARRLALVMAEMESAQGVVAALANAVEAKDTMTEHHCQRLAGLAHLLATAAELDPVSIKGVVFGALLHDIGKIGVSDAYPQEARRPDRRRMDRDAPPPDHRRADLPSARELPRIRPDRPASPRALGRREATRTA